MKTFLVFSKLLITADENPCLHNLDLSIALLSSSDDTDSDEIEDPVLENSTPIHMIFKRGNHGLLGQNGINAMTIFSSLLILFNQGKITGRGTNT